MGVVKPLQCPGSAPVDRVAMGQHLIIATMGNLGIVRTIQIPLQVLVYLIEVWGAKPHFSDS